MTQLTTHVFAGLTLLAIATAPASAGEVPAAYSTPQVALEAMMGALQNAKPREATLEVFGSDAEDLLSSGNPQRDRGNRAEILRLYAEGFRFQPADDGSVVVLLGSEAWPFPIPIARTGSKWSFDIEAGRDELYHRRIGLNELEAIEFMKAYVDIQSEYRLVDHDGDRVMEFSQSFLSSEGERDGLFWNDPDSPLGIRIALATLDGYNDGEKDVEPEPFGGYYYRILHGQGESAPGGMLDYIVGGNMISGHALLAVPSDYGNTGVHTFLVSENGTVLEADLGEESLDIAFEITRFNPDDKWTAVE